MWIIKPTPRLYTAFLFTALLPVPLSARDKTDVIYLNNGDRVTCEIKGLDSGVPYISVEYLLRTESLEWSNVRCLESSQLFIVKTEDGRSYVGKLSTAEAVDLSTGALPALSQAGRVHVSTNAAYYVKVFSSLKWNVSFYGNCDNHPPPGFSGSDYGTSSGLGWTLGNR